MALGTRILWIVVALSWYVDWLALLNFFLWTGSIGQVKNYTVCLGRLAQFGLNFYLKLSSWTWMASGLWIGL